ncbi:MAG: pilin [Patescibacteria group bacterium]|nr:pilin [Patescibacteria group bacterium]
MLNGIVLAGSLNLAPNNGLAANAIGFTPERIVSALILFALVIAALVFFFMLLWGGIEWILAGGDKNKTEEARGRITGALIGLVIVFAAWAIVNLASTFLGTSLTNLTIPNI